MSHALTGPKPVNQLPQVTDCYGTRSTPIHPETNTHIFEVKQHPGVKLKIVCGLNCGPEVGVLELSNLFTNKGKVEGSAGMVLWADRPFDHSCSDSDSGIEAIQATN